MSDPQRLFLMGYRGSGKTIVARLLAERLGLDWLDADTFLESRYQRTIRQIFAEEGEVGFRDKESVILAELAERERIVIATGGGIVLRPQNREKLQTGRVVWLTADAETLWQRINADASTVERRPNLSVGGLAEVEQLLQVREPLYRECAHTTVSTMNRTPEQVADAILSEVAARPI